MSHCWLMLIRFGGGSREGGAPRDKIEWLTVRRSRVSNDPGLSSAVPLSSAVRLRLTGTLTL